MKTGHKILEKKIYLVRHGQASLGAADYDNLSPLGEQQAERLGKYFASRGVAFDAVYAGTLRRHAQTYAAILRGFEGSMDARPQGTWLTDRQALQSNIRAALRPGLNEYDSDAVIGAIATPEHIAAMKSPTSPDGYKQHFAALRRGIGAWMRGDAQPAGMSSYADFAGGVMRVLDEVRACMWSADSTVNTVLISSSGGPLSSAVAQVLGLSHEAGIELNMRMRNTAVSELIVTPKRCVLLTFNTLPHLDDPSSDDDSGRAMQTYA
jgi:broad specificity phosphatase PhoE